MGGEKNNQNYLRGDGKLPSILVQAQTISDGWHKAMIACKDSGLRVETPKYVSGQSLGYDADINVRVANPMEDFEKNQRHKFGLFDDDRGIMQYILEVTHGIHNHWKKDPNDPNDTRWGYTYNERFNDQIPLILARIKYDWDKRRRITGRDYQWTTWRPEEDIILEQEDPPCLQRGHFRFAMNSQGVWVCNYVSDWRSRDESKAWEENNKGQAKLQNNFALKVSDMLGIPVLVGSYSDRSSSLHIYGKYVDEDRIEAQIEQMRAGTLNDFLVPLFIEDEKKLKRIIAAQIDAELRGEGQNQSEDRLERLGYDLDTFTYPTDWDCWPKSWDVEPDPIILFKGRKNVIEESMIRMIIKAKKVLGSHYKTATLKQVLDDLKTGKVNDRLRASPFCGEEIDIKEFQERIKAYELLASSSDFWHGGLRNLDSLFKRYRS